MNELLGSIQYNTNGDVIVSSSYLTYQLWVGFVGFVSKSDKFLKLKNNERNMLMLSSLKSGKHLDSGVCDTRWASADRVLVGTEKGEVMLFKLNDREKSEPSFEPIFNKLEHDGMLTCIETKYGDTMAMSGSDDARIKVWDIDHELSTKTYSAHEYSICSISLNPKSLQQFISCSEDGMALLWDTRKETPALSIKHNLSGYPSASSWSSVDSNLIAFGSETGQLGIYDIRLLADKPFILSKLHERYVRRVAFHENLSYIATVSEDCKTIVNKIAASSVLSDAHLNQIYSNKHNDYVTGVSWNPTKDNELLTCSWDGYVLTHELNFKEINGY